VNVSVCWAGTFPKNKTPGNDGLTIEFYLASWPLFGRLLVDSMNYAFAFGELSTSLTETSHNNFNRKERER